MSNRSLAYHLGFYISLALFFVFGTFTYYIIRYHAENSKKSVENSAILLSQDIFRNVRDKVLLTQELASGISRQIGFFQKYGESENYLKSILDDRKYLQTILVRFHDREKSHIRSFLSVSRSNGEIVFTDNPGDSGKEFNVDSLFRYFGNLRGEKWSEPFRTRKGEVVSAYHLPFEFKEQGNGKLFSGDVICLISFGFLDKLISETKIWENGYAFLISDKGTFVTYPIKELVLERNLFALPPGDIREDLVRIPEFMAGTSGPITVYPPALNHAKAWSFPNRIPENKWLLVTVIPVSELQKGLRTMILKMSGILVLLIGIVYLLVLFITGRVMKPLSKASYDLHLFGVEHLDQSSRAKNETVTIRESLKKFQEKYEKYQQNIKESSIKSARLKADLEAASEIQQSILPPPGHYQIPRTGISIHSVFKPAQIVSGDLFDFFMIDQSHLLFTIGDVSGGGVPAALFMGVAHTLIKSNALAGTAREIVSQVNKQLGRKNTNQFFLTLFLGILHTETGILNYCNAGHVPTFLVSSSGNVKELADPHGIPLGLNHDTSYKDSTVHMKQGDHLILYTDGITEQANEDGDYFGVDGFYALFNQFKSHSPDEIAEMIVKRVGDFAGNAKHTNDLSLMVIGFKNTETLELS
jgi:sigma-B regulation protein RsbU (phosphoserine phosphatase)